MSGEIFRFFSTTNIDIKTKTVLLSVLSGLLDKAFHATLLYNPLIVSPNYFVINGNQVHYLESD